MSIDTVRLKSGFISTEILESIKCHCYRSDRTHLGTGEIVYQLTNGSLRGSWDHAISVQVRDYEFVYTGKTPKKVSTPPFVIVEASAHKAYLGHNVFGGPKDFQAACKHLIDIVSDAIEAPLPAPDTWQVERIDWAECYVLEPEAIKQFISSMSNCTFPRRKINRYEDESIYITGSTTTLKLYHKGPEFRRHDKKRLQKIPGIAHEIQRLQNEADKRLRVEVEFKSKKIVELFGKAATVAQIDVQKIVELHEREIKRLIKEGELEMKTVRTNYEVRERLRNIYSDQLASRLFQHWLEFATVGERDAKSHLKKSTFYRVRAQFKKAGVSWYGSNVCVIANDTLLPINFRPLQSDPRRCTASANDAQIRIAA